MGRTNLVILGIGIGACVILSLMMQHVLKVKQDRDVPAIVGELMQAFGQHFSKSAEFTIRHEDVGPVGEVVVYPLMSASRRRLARKVGHYAWRNLGDDYEVVALVVVCDDGFDKRSRYLVPSPRDVGRSMRELREGERVRHQESTNRLGPRRAGAKTGKARRTRPEGLAKPKAPPATDPKAAAEPATPAASAEKNGRKSQSKPAKPK